MLIKYLSQIWLVLLLRDYMLTKVFGIIDKYAGDDSKHRHVSVLRADIPPNHPPVHVTVAGRDYLRDEGMAYSLRLRDAGVDSQLEIVPGVPHGLTFPPTTHVARQFFMNQARVLDYALNAA